MRVIACCLLILGALAVADSRPVPAAAARCAPATNSNGQPVKSKPSSFAPRHGHRHVYGQPIESPIFGNRAHHQPRKPPSSPQP
jgi:hypothetical protein